MAEEVSYFCVVAKNVVLGLVFGKDIFDQRVSSDFLVFNE